MIFSLNDAPIKEFSGEYRFLSNFWYSPITLGPMTFPTAEHGYQAAKSLKLNDWKLIHACETPGQAKRMGRKITIRSDWDDIKLDAMKEILDKKFSIPKLAEKLIATGDAELVEGNNWGDTFWGVSRGKGENHLGKILMIIREEIQLNQ